MENENKKESMSKFYQTNRSLFIVSLVTIILSSVFGLFYALLNNFVTPFDYLTARAILHFNGAILFFSFMVLVITITIGSKPKSLVLSLLFALLLDGLLFTWGMDKIEQGMDKINDVPYLTSQEFVIEEGIVGDIDYHTSSKSNRGKPVLTDIQVNGQFYYVYGYLEYEDVVDLIGELQVRLHLVPHSKEVIIVDVLDNSGEVIKTYDSRLYE